MSLPAPVLEPGATIGILGSGQLARMLALAAARLGFKCHIFAPDRDSPAFDVVRESTRADYEDEQALARFAEHVDVVTYEFENVPAETATLLASLVPVLPDPKVLAITQDRIAEHVDVVTYEFENIPAETATLLASLVPVLPDPKVLATTQDRIAEKDFIAGLGIGTAAYAAVGTAAELLAALDRVGRPAVLKTRRFGYDGKGQATIGKNGAVETAWQGVGGKPSILEAFVPFAREVSVVAARAADGTVECFDVTENEHRDHILKVSRVPAAVSDQTAREARRIAETIAHRFGYVGVLAVEMFVLPDGALLVNEIAPRVHNSGHWTLDGASVSQFEQHIRAVAGWPLAKAIRKGRVEMINLIGHEVDDYRKWLTVPGAAVHLYGKIAVRPGRKMGHVTRLLAD